MPFFSANNTPILLRSYSTPNLPRNPGSGQASRPSLSSDLPATRTSPPAQGEALERPLDPTTVNLAGSRSDSDISIPSGFFASKPSSDTQASHPLPTDSSAFRTTTGAQDEISREHKTLQELLLEGSFRSENTRNLPLLTPTDASGNSSHRSDSYISVLSRFSASDRASESDSNEHSISEIVNMGKQVLQQHRDFLRHAASTSEFVEKGKMAGTSRPGGDGIRHGNEAVSHEIQTERFGRTQPTQDVLNPGIGGENSLLHFILKAKDLPPAERKQIRDGLSAMAKLEKDMSEAGCMPKMGSILYPLHGGNVVPFPFEGGAQTFSQLANTNLKDKESKANLIDMAKTEGFKPYYHVVRNAEDMQKLIENEPWQVQLRTLQANTANFLAEERLGLSKRANRLSAYSGLVGTVSLAVSVAALSLAISESSQN